MAHLDVRTFLPRSVRERPAAARYVEKVDQEARHAKVIMYAVYGSSYTKTSAAIISLAIAANEATRVLEMRAEETC